VALLERRIDIVHFGRPRTLIPQHDDAGAVARRNHAFERPILDWMILDHHREALGRGVERGTLRHGPREEHAVVLQTEVVMKMTGEMFLDAEETWFCAFGLLRPLGNQLGVARRLRTFLEISLR